MLDRKRANELPANQVSHYFPSLFFLPWSNVSSFFFLFQIGFLNGICLPCYELMAKLLPGCQPMLDGAKYAHSLLTVSFLLFFVHNCKYTHKLIKKNCNEIEYINDDKYFF